MRYLDNDPGQIYQQTLIERYQVRYRAYSATNIQKIYIDTCYIYQEFGIRVLEREEWKVVVEKLIEKYDELDDNPLWFKELIDIEALRDYEMPAVTRWDDDIQKRASEWYFKRTKKKLSEHE